MKTTLNIAALFLALVPFATHGADFAAQCLDRAAIERVYHSHRIGITQTFEELMPVQVIEQLVRVDATKESALRTVYHLEVTPAMLAAEVQRIQTTTRAPEVLAEIQHALGDSEPRFASAMARPLVVEREWRRRFDNDATLHAAQRHEAEQARMQLLAKQMLKDMRDVTWQFGARRDATKAEEGKLNGGTTVPTKANSKSSLYSNEATAQLSQTIAAPTHAEHRQEELYFEDLEPELRNVLRVQLQKPGDVSAVIELPTCFLIFFTKARTADILSAASVVIPKRSYETWLAPQP